MRSVINMSLVVRRLHSRDVDSEILREKSNPPRKVASLLVVDVRFDGLLRDKNQYDTERQGFISMPDGFKR